MAKLLTTWESRLPQFCRVRRIDIWLEQHQRERQTNMGSYISPVLSRCTGHYLVDCFDPSGESRGQSQFDKSILVKKGTLSIQKDIAITKTS